MKFIPFDNKVQIIPSKNDSYASEELIEKGSVVSVGKGCNFLKVGDTVFFESWGIGKTPEDENGNHIYTLAEDSRFILGKYAGKKRV